MKNNMFLRAGMMIAAAMIVLVSLQETFAAGTRAGTLLTSTATINYNDKNGSAMSSVNGSVSVYVAHRPASTLAISTSNSQGYDGGYVVYTMEITNNGNGQDVFQILSNVTSGVHILIPSDSIRTLR
jgi:hypothetical protein